MSLKNIEQDMNNKYDNKILSFFVRVQTDQKYSQCLGFKIFKCWYWKDQVCYVNSVKLNTWNSIISTGTKPAKQNRE